MKALFKSVNLIGDALYVGPALRAWIRQQKGPLDVWIQTLDDHVAPLYLGMVRDLWNPNTTVNTFGLCYDRPNIQFDFEHIFDVNAAFKLSDEKKQHLATSYADLLGVSIGDKRENLKPIFIPDPGAGDPALEGCILVSMFSASCTSHDPKCNFVPNKCVPCEKWKPMINFLEDHFPGAPIYFLGAPTDKLPENLMDGGPERAMFGIPLNRLALIMKKAKLLVTIDNGMSHLGASQETPTFLMYPRCLAPYYILPIGNQNLVWVHMDPVKVDPAYLLNGLKYAIRKFEKTIWRKK